MILRILSALLLAGALIVAGCGDDDTSSDGSAADAPGNAVDRAFIADMIPHHESAVEMARIAQRRGQSEFVKGLAGEIVRTQNEEIELMRGEDEKLAAAGIAKGSLGVPQHMMGMDHDMASLRDAKSFDKAFMTMMIPHHEGAVTMSKAEIAKGRSRRLKTLAQDIIDGQRREIRAMRQRLGSGGDAGGKMDDGAEHGAAHPG